MSKFLIYGLIDPRTNELRYVGKSSRGISRPKCHTQPHGRRGNGHCQRWLQNLYLKEKRVPSIIILKECKSELETLNQECYFIKYFKELGFPLTNLTDGGDGLSGHIFSEEHKRKIGLANIGRKYSDEVRKNMSLAQKGHKPTLGFTGGKHSEETKRFYSEFFKGNTYCVGRTPHNKGKIGYKISEESIDKIRKTLTGKPKTKIQVERAKTTRSIRKWIRKELKSYWVDCFASETGAS